MGNYPFALAGPALAAALAGQTIPGPLTLSTGNLTLSNGGYSGGPVDVVGGGGLKVSEAANGKQGTAVLAAGTVTVANTSITANSRIMLTCQALGTVVAPSALCVSARVVGTSFTILASQATDTSTIAYEIFEPG